MRQKRVKAIRRLFHSEHGRPPRKAIFKNGIVTQKSELRAFRKLLRQKGLISNPLGYEF